MTRGSRRCASTGNAATPQITATTIRPSPTSPTGSVEAALQQQRVQPPTVLEPDGDQPARIDEAAIAVQRKRGVGAVVRDDGDDLPNSDIGAARQQRVE